MKKSTIPAHDQHGTNALESFSQAIKYNKWLLSRISPFLQKEKLLEIGCGMGNISKLLKENYDLTCVDIRKDYIQQVSKELQVEAICCDLAEEKKFNNQFDSAICLNVLEHIKEETAALNNIYHALKPGGHFAVLVPAFNWLYGSIDKALHHHRRYTRKSLKEVLQKSGFNVKKSFYFNAFAIPGWFLQNKVLKKNDLPSGQLKLFNACVPILRYLDIPFRYTMGISVIAYAEKPASPLKD